MSETAEREDGRAQIEQIVDLVRSARVSRADAIELVEQYGRAMASSGKVEAAKHALALSSGVQP